MITILNPTEKQRLAAIARNKARICDLLKWQMDEYHTNMWNTGLIYLHKYLQCDSAVKQVHARKEFWNWWINLWNARDEAFVDEWDGLEDATTTADLRTLYCDINNPAVLACEIKPPAIVYGADFTTIKLAE